MTSVAATAASIVAALSWDPQIRGFSIVLLAVAILCGSVYAILATNTGAKLGLLLALTGLTGWMMLMGILWTTFGIGLKGDPPAWKVEEIVAGDADAATSGELEDFPRGWEKLEPGNAILADAQAAADHALSSSAQETGGEAGHGGGAAEEPEFAPPFEQATDYVFVAGYRKGGEDSFLPGKVLEHERGIFHAPHYAIVQVRPALEAVSLDGAPTTPRPDPSKEPYTVVMIRDLGSLRFPSFVLTVSMAILFGVCVNVLHKRDRQLTEPQTALA